MLSNIKYFTPRSAHCVLFLLLNVKVSDILTLNIKSLNHELCDHQIFTILQTRRPTKRNASNGLGRERRFCYTDYLIGMRDEICTAYGSNAYQTVLLVCPLLACTIQSWSGLLPKMSHSTITKKMFTWCSAVISDFLLFICH